MDLHKQDRVLIFAPHNDDEILGAGGILQQYKDVGAKVKIVIFTNGDGQIRRPRFLPLPRANFIKLGYRRQKESIRALKTLDFSSEDLHFLGYPDRGLGKLWTTNWDYNSLFHSRFTGSTHSPYDNSYRQNAPYCGKSVAKDLREILWDFKPNVVFFPHPNDSHSDHWATSGFVTYSLSQWKSGNRGSPNSVRSFSYLVHRGKFPSPRGQYLEASLDPPAELMVLDTEWEKVPLPLEERQRKLLAISKYRSQTQLMRKYLRSFARANELFGKVPPISLESSTEFPESHESFPALFPTREDDRAITSYLDPKRRSRLASLRRYTDIKSVQLQEQNSGLIEIKVRFYNRFYGRNEVRTTIKPLSPANGSRADSSSFTFYYRKNKLYVNGENTAEKREIDFEIDPRAFTLRLPKSEIQAPEKMIISVELLRKGAPFARSANRLIEVQ